MLNMLKNALMQLQLKYLVTDPSGVLTQITGSHSPQSINGSLQNVIWGYVLPPLMTIGTAFAVAGMIWVAVRLISSAFFENSRSRAGAVVALVACISGVVIMVNAQAIVGAVGSIKLFS